MLYKAKANVDGNHLQQDSCKHSWVAASYAGNPSGMRERARQSKMAKSGRTKLTKMGHFEGA